MVQYTFLSKGISASVDAGLRQMNGISRIVLTGAKSFALWENSSNGH